MLSKYQPMGHSCPNHSQAKFYAIVAEAHLSILTRAVSAKATAEMGLLTSSPSLSQV